MRSQKIKDEINLLNAEMCEMIGLEYRLSRGFTNPLGEAGKEKRGPQSELLRQRSWRRLPFQLCDMSSNRNRSGICVSRSCLI